MTQQANPLMPHATASWLVDSTGLTFEQIAEFCGIHILEVQAMADDLAGSKYTGRDPVHAGELSNDEIERGQADPSYRLKMQKAPVQVTRTKGPRYTPVSKRQDKPDGIAWILRNFRCAGRQADRHHPQHHRRDPRSQPLEHLQHQSEGPGDTGAVLAA